MIIQRARLRALTGAAVATRWLYASAYVVALAPAVILAFSQPVWSRVDEAQHVDVLVQYAHGVYPVEGRTTIRPETLEVMRETGVYRWQLPGAAPVPGELDPSRFRRPPALQPGTYPYQLWTVRHLWSYSYEAMQPPLFYVLAMPVWVVGDQVRGLLGGIYAVRLLNALLLAALAPLALALGRSLGHSLGAVAGVAVPLVAVMPGLVLNGSQAGNDTLVAVLGAASVLVAVRCARSGWRLGYGLLLGLLVGAAILTKLTAIGLLPVMAAAFLFPRWQPLVLRLRAAAPAAAVSFGLFAPWLAVNDWIYGQPLPGRAARLLLGQFFTPPSLQPSFVARSAKHSLSTFLTGEPYNTFLLVRPLGYLALAMVVVGVVGVVRLLRSHGEQRVPVALLAVAVAGQAAWVAVMPFLSQVGGYAPGRYLYPVAAPALVLLAAGLWEIAILRLLLLGSYLLMATGMLAAFSAGAIGDAPELPKDMTAPSTQVSAHGSGQGLDVAVDRVAIVSRDGIAWVHVRVRNTGSQAVDWSPAPAARAADGTPMHGVYAASTSMPERLQPGAGSEGWVELRADHPLTPAGARHLDLLFNDVAPADYSNVVTVVVPVTPGG